MMYENILPIIQMNEELGNAFKSYRIKNNISAKTVVNAIGKTASYISKFEKGDIKKVETKLLIKMCDVISNNGLNGFISYLSNKYDDYSEITKLIIMNLDDIVLEKSIPKELVKYMQDYIQKKEISISSICDALNHNSDLTDNIEEYPYYNTMPVNIWYSVDNKESNACIKFDIEFSYISDLFNGKISKINSVFIEGILYAMFKLGNEKCPRKNANKLLDKYHVSSIRKVVYLRKKENTNIAELGLEPDVVNAYNAIMEMLKLYLEVSNEKNHIDKASIAIKMMASNMNKDLGFFIAYNTRPAFEFDKNDFDRKQAFLNELDELYKKYLFNEEEPENENKINIYN